MSGKVCERGHGYAAYLAECPYCQRGREQSGSLRKDVTKGGGNVTPGEVAFRNAPGRPRVYANNAERQKAYRARKPRTKKPCPEYRPSLYGQTRTRVKNWPTLKEQEEVECE